LTQTINLDDLLTSKEAATLLGIKSNTLEIWRHQGRGPSFLKLGDSPQSTVRYQRSAVVAWASQRSFTSTSGHSTLVRAKRDSSFNAASGRISALCPTHLPASSKPRGASD
jgi:hypothetical protein